MCRQFQNCKLKDQIYNFKFFTVRRMVGDVVGSGYKFWGESRVLKLCILIQFNDNL